MNNSINTVLNTVLEINVQPDDFYIKNNILSYSYFRKDHEWAIKEINIYELAYKCKEWADKQNFAIRSYIWFGKGKSTTVDLEDNIPNKGFEAISEVEAIFQAAEYILNQIDAKSATINLQ